MKRKHTSYSNEDDRSGHNNKKKKALTLQQRKDRIISLTNIKGYNMLMDTYIKDGRPEEAIITFDSLLAREHKSSIKPNVYAYTTVINAHIELGQFLKGTERYTEMISRGITPDVETINTIMKLYMRLKRPNDVIDCFDFFKEYNLNPSVVSYNTLMDAHIEKADYTEAINVFEVMQDNDVLPSTVTINTIMKLYLKVNEPHNAILIHGLFKKYNISQSEYSFNILINAYTEKGDYDKAFQVFDEMIATNYIPTAPTINTIMKLHLKLKEPHQAIKTHTLHKKYGVKEDVYSFSILIKAFSEAGLYNKAIEVFNQMQNRPDVRIDEVTISSMMHLYNKMNKPDKTIDTFELYQQYNIEPNIIAYNCLIKAYQSQNNIKAACDTIRMLHSKGIKCDTYTFQPVLKHYQMRGDKRRFYRSWNTMIDKYKVKPDRHLYSIKDKLDQFTGPPLNERPCPQFQRTGSCRYGRDCKFKH